MVVVDQFAAEFEKECRRVAQEQGVDFPERFSATDMIRFKDPDLIPEMLNAVAVLKQHGKLPTYTYTLYLLTYLLLFT